MSHIQKLAMLAIVLAPIMIMATLYRYDIATTPSGYIKHDRWTGHIETCTTYYKSRHTGSLETYTKCQDG